MAANYASPATADAWNFYYAQVTGVPQTADLFDPAVGRDEPISVDVYLSRRVAAGLEADAWPSNWGPDNNAGMAGFAGSGLGMGSLSPWAV